MERKDVRRKESEVLLNRRPVKPGLSSPLRTPGEKKNPGKIRRTHITRAMINLIIARLEKV